jgi:predicted HTH domain antitoxin
MVSQVISQRMGILLEWGLFESEESLMLSAYRSLLTLQPGLKTELALSLYEREEISLGRAAEIAGVSREQMKEILASRGIERRIAVRSPERVAEDVQFLLGRR